ncbi:MAG: undecaprenyl-diphosphate phosphatase, partial [Candidatus Magasanikbacteria bacterium]|nr:undecaprenyl-diphosphate phosphatase [Candidatus Magasanikbacteria bacterium]
MTIFQAIILGLIQGLTEFLPISSSGHLIFLPLLFGWEDQGVAFDIMVHLGTLIAVVVYFRKKVVQLFLSLFSKDTVKKKDRFLAWAVIASIIPAGIVGSMLETNSRSALIVGWSFILWGVVLGLADWHAKRQEKKGIQTSDLNHLSLKQVIFMSLAQAMALIPG